MVRDEVLGLTRQRGELVHPSVAAGELPHELPAQWVGDQLKELDRRGVRMDDDHARKYIRLD
jgi:hypothetical protein